MIRILAAQHWLTGRGFPPKFCGIFGFYLRTNRIMYLEQIHTRPLSVNANHYHVVIKCAKRTPLEIEPRIARFEV